MDFKFCLLAGGLLAQIASRVTRTCPKVIISRLIGDDWGIANDAKMPVTRSTKIRIFKLKLLNN